MPYVRRPKPGVPSANVAAVNSPLARTVLPTKVILKPPQQKVPFPTLAHNQSSIVLDVPTFGPLPPPSRTIVPTIVPSATNATVPTVVPVATIRHHQPTVVVNRPNVVAQPRRPAAPPVRRVR